MAPGSRRANAVVSGSPHPAIRAHPSHAVPQRTLPLADATRNLRFARHGPVCPHVGPETSAAEGCRPLEPLPVFRSALPISPADSSLTPCKDRARPDYTGVSPSVPTSCTWTCWRRPGGPGARRLKQLWIGKGGQPPSAALRAEASYGVGQHLVLRERSRSFPGTRQEALLGCPARRGAPMPRLSRLAASPIHPAVSGPAHKWCVLPAPFSFSRNILGHCPRRPSLGVHEGVASEAPLARAPNSL